MTDKYWKNASPGCENNIFILIVKNVTSRMKFELLLSIEFLEIFPEETSNLSFQTTFIYIYIYTFTISYQIWNQCFVKIYILRVKNFRYKKIKYAQYKFLDTSTQETQTFHFYVSHFQYSST